MGLKIGEQIRTYYFYGVSSIADLAYVIYDEAGLSWATGNMTELGSTGIYYVDWTPDAAGVWIFKIIRGTVKDAFVYHVGQGQEADIELLHDVPTVDGTADAHMRDIIGKKNDAAVTTAGTTKSLIAYAKGMLALAADLITRTKGLDDIHDDLVTVLADTNELQGDWVNDGRLDIILDAILADSNELQVDWANDGRLDIIIDAILADTAELQGDWANDGRLDIILDAVLADTGELQNDWVDGGRLDLLIDSIIANIADLIVRAKGLDDIHDDLVTVLADTNVLQVDWANDGRLDLLIDAILADSDELQLDWANGGRLDLLIDLILADTGELQTDWADGGRLDLILDAILADTGELQADWANDGRLDLLLDSVIASLTFVTTALGSEFDGSPDLYDVLVAGYTTAVTRLAVGSIIQRLQLLQETQIAGNTVFTTSEATVNTVTCAALVDTADLYEGMMLVPLDGDQAGQGRYITAYDGDDVLTVVPDWSTDPDGSGAFKFVVVPTPVKFNYEAGKGLSAIYDLVNGIPVLTRIYNDYNILVLTDEETVFEYDNAAYVWHPEWLVYHLDELQGGEQLEVKVYEKDNDTDDAWVLIYHGDTTGVVAVPGIYVQLPPVDLAFKVTVEQTGGVLRDVLFKLYKKS